MLKKLYELGYFNYQKYIIEHMKELSLNSDETIILINILDFYKDDKTLSSEKLSQRLSLTKAKIDKALASLLERQYYEIYINYDNGIGQEYISLDGFFNKAEAFIDANSSMSDDELHLVCQYISKEMNRILTSQELEIIQSMVIEDRYSLDDIKKAREVLKINKKLLTMKNLAQALVVKSEPVKPVNNVLKDFINNIK
ncbi:TPA: hypothetical protein IAA91_05845 [Candidatus Avacholeplasma faecigallinarum]|nr:hypothetical protein [Candidatus Avacholeplasma faecigallinarum]